MAGRRLGRQTAADPEQSFAAGRKRPFIRPPNSRQRTIFLSTHSIALYTNVQIWLGLMTRYLDTVPHPWNHAVIETAIFKSFTDARTAIEDTEGGRLWRSIQELDDSVYVLETNISDLLDEISLFSDRSKNPAFWDQGDGSEADRHTREVKRKLSNCTAALMALVDHARNFTRVSPVSEYAEELKKHFSSPGLHDFLQCLRNYNTHWRIAQANWKISHNFEVKSRQARFLVTKTELLAWNGWNAMARATSKALRMQ